MEILLGLVGILIGGIQAWIGFSFKRLTSKVDLLFEHRVECMKQFADKEENSRSHARIYSRVDDHEVRISRLEGKRVNPGARQVHDD